MAGSYYSEINQHLTWRTKLSRPLLNPDVESMAWVCLREKAANLGDIFVHEIGRTANHVQLAITIEPTVLNSDLTGQLKSYSPHEVNRRLGVGHTVLQWQTGYGVVGCGTEDLPWVVRYIQNQRVHHPSGQVFDRLERIHCFNDVALMAQADKEQAP